MKIDAAARGVELILSDVDGVLTDGGIVFDNQGIETKNRRDTSACLTAAAEVARYAINADLAYRRKKHNEESYTFGDGRIGVRN